MSRSFRKTSICGMCSGSDKKDKRFARKKLRRINKSILSLCLDYDNLILKLLREISSVWGFQKDGKFWFNIKDDDYYKKLLRK